MLNCLRRLTLSTVNDLGRGRYGRKRVVGIHPVLKPSHCAADKPLGEAPSLPLLLGQLWSTWAARIAGLERLKVLDVTHVYSRF